MQEPPGSDGMSPARFLPPRPRWALVSLAALTALALSIALHHYGFAAHATMMTDLATGPQVERLLYDNTAPAPSGPDAAAFTTTTSPQSNLSTHTTITPWHPLTIEYSALTILATIQQGRIEIAHHPLLGAGPVLVKRAPAASLPGHEPLARETEVYRLLHGWGVTPLFLGHVAEGGVVTGFVAEYVDVDEARGGRGKGERDERGDMGTEACLAALRRMHARGVAHMDAHGGNCLVRGGGGGGSGGGEAVLVDFELAEVRVVGQGWGEGEMEGKGKGVEEFERDLWVMRYSRLAEEGS